MDQFLNLAKQGLGAYQDHQVKKTGGAEFNEAPSNQGGYKTGAPAGIDHDEAIRTAEREGSGGASLFESAMRFINQNQSDHDKPLNEQEVTEAHERAYGHGSTSGMSADSLGNAAAMQILKQFMGGSDHGSHGEGGKSQTKLISLAMAEASKLFDKNPPAQGNKQDAVNSAGMTIVKLLFQSKFGGGHTTGGKDSGGLGSLMGMASKFMH